MTTVLESGLASQQTHALVIAVDHYLFCGPERSRPGPFQHYAKHLTDLSSPSESATTVATWLCDHLIDDPYRPLGSLELLISARQPMQFDAGSGPAPVEGATFQQTEDAFNRWYDRCDRNPDNVALLFFFGHGCRIGQDDVLLLADVGSNPNAFFTNAWDFRRTQLAMRDCRCQTQCSFIDTCRSNVEEQLDVVPDSARSFRQPSTTFAPRKHAPMVYSTTAGADALTPRGRPSPFALAVLDALSGLAAVETNQYWEVRTADLATTINRVLQWNRHPDSEGEPQVADSGGSHPGDSVIRVLREAPQVPFRITCAPEEAIASAQLRLCRAAEELVRSPCPEPWQGRAPAGEHQLKAGFPLGDYHSREAPVGIRPPNRTYALEVRPV
ncbi:MAG: caspase family protein [Micromonosporaceae bacterium]|nr:caspase family protein [Micromonosporaceae bacterium]